MTRLSNSISLVGFFVPLLLLAGSASAGFDDFAVPFGFSDDFYLENGVDPSSVTNRLGTPDSLFPAFPEESGSADHSDFRNFFVIPATSHSGDSVFFHIMAALDASAFTDDNAGDEAFETAEEASLWVFPIAVIDPVNTPLPWPFRQESVMDLRHGYFSNNPLGLWVLKFGLYTDKAVKQRDSNKILRRLGRKNGVSPADGLPFIRTRSDIRKLVKKGLLDIVTRPLTGGLPRYSVCPTYKDPRDGAIRPDNIPLPGSGPSFVEEILSLRSTGDWPNP